MRLVGPGKTFATLGAAVAAANAGDTICMSAGLYQDNFATISKPLTIVGVGGYAHLEAVSSPPDGKGILTIDKDVTIRGLEFSGASVPDQNGAGIRWEGGALTVEQSYFHNNEDGILGGGTIISVKNSKFVDNGFGDGQSHAMYVVGNKTVVDSTYFESTNVGHHLKSLAPETIVTNSTFEDGLGDSDHIPSYSIDLPAGSTATILNNTFIQRDGQGNPGATNGIIINYAHSQPSPAAPPDQKPDSLTVQGNTIRNFRSGGILVENSTSSVAQIIDNRLAGSGTTIVSGAANVSGNFSGPQPVVPLGAPIPTIVDDYANGLAVSGGVQSSKGIQGNSGMTRLGSTVFVSNRYQGVAIFDAATGSSTLYHGPQDIEALGNDGTNLLAGLFTSDTVLKMATDGTVLSTITLNITDHLGITGLDSDGTRVFVGSFDDGDVHIFDMAGDLLGLISTGLGADVLSGLSYDRSDGTLWLTAGFGDGSVRHFDLAGDLLGTFDLMITGNARDIPVVALFDATVTPPVVVEPGTVTLFTFALAGVAWWHRRRMTVAAA